MVRSVAPPSEGNEVRRDGISPAWAGCSPGLGSAVEEVWQVRPGVAWSEDPLAIARHERAGHTDWIQMRPTRNQNVSRRDTAGIPAKAQRFSCFLWQKT